MSTAIGRLQALQVADVMTGNVTTVRADQAMAEAARILLAHRISGAPVVDEAGKCIGMLSASDFLRHEAARQSAATQSGSADAHGPPQKTAAPQPAVQNPAAPHGTLPPPEPWLAMEPFRHLVRANMSWGVQTVAPEASLVEAARMMSSAHVHRLPVLDKAGKPVGMLTSLDLACAMLNAVEEANQAEREEKPRGS